MMQNTAKQNYPGSVASYDTQPGNKMISAKAKATHEL